MTGSHLNLDVSAEGARALHRVVRAMHDGHCPSCGYLAPSDQFVFYDRGHAGRSFPCRDGHQCPSCRFRITAEQEAAALAAFRPYLNKSVEVFEAWRNGQPIDSPNAGTP